jgi:hypothetical protein
MDTDNRLLSVELKNGNHWGKFVEVFRHDIMSMAARRLINNVTTTIGNESGSGNVVVSAGDIFETRAKPNRPPYESAAAAAPTAGVAPEKLVKESSSDDTASKMDRKSLIGVSFQPKKPSLTAPTSAKLVRQCNACGVLFQSCHNCPVK